MRFVPCWSTALLALCPTHDGAARVDTPTTPSPAQVLQHQTLIDEPRAKTIKKTTILYTEPILKSNFKRKSFDITKTKLSWCKHKKGNANANKNKRNKRDNIMMHKTSRHNIKNNNYVKLKHLKRDVPFMNQVVP